MTDQHTTLSTLVANDLIQQNLDLKAELEEMTDRRREACRQLRVTRKLLNRMTLDHGLRDSESARVGG